MSDDRLRHLRVLYATIFLSATGLGTTTFLLPVYAASIGASYVDLGLLGAVGNIVYTVFTLMTGLLLDRFERLRLYTVYAFMGALILGFFTLADDLPRLVFARALMGVASASFWVSASTLTADISPPERLTQSMGRYNLSWITGFAIGPYLGGLVSSNLGFNTLFLCTASLMVASGLLSQLMLRPRLSLRNRSGSEGLSLAPFRRLSAAYLTLLPFTMVLGIYMAIVPGHLSLEGLTASTVGLLVTMTNVARGLTFFNVERFVAWGARRSVALASALLVSGMLVFSYSTGLAGYASALALYGVAAGIMTPVVLDYIAKRCEPGSLGAAMGLHEGVYGVGMFIGPLAGG
ncbi:MAG TPA: MFS transporter, partial [Candidatus Desulfaltia sp.]|nr:MFS transporter [Candidatus Desulfaltia sp.]